MWPRMLLMSTFVVGLIGLAGCSGSSGPAPAGMPKEPTVPTSGILTYKGKPLENASIRLVSINGQIAGGGKTDAAGTFVISTYGQSDGIPPGKYKVVVAVTTVKEESPGVLAPEPEGGFKSPIPAKYANPATTDVIVEVENKPKVELTIDLK